jgi:integrase
MSEAHFTAQPARNKPAEPCPQPESQEPSLQPAVVKTRSKPAKPYPEFPLTAHPAGYWCKKIRGKVHYFGPWNDPEGALKKYDEQKEALHAGRKPKADTEGTTVKQAANAFNNAKRRQRDNGELSPRTWQGYKDAADEVVATFGKGRLVADLDPDDFARLRNKMAKRLGPHGLGTFVQCVRCLFKYAADNGLIDRPVQYGTSFRKPSKKVIRKHKAEQGAKLFAAEEIRRLIDNAIQPFRAMLLLGINCGMGNSDIGNLPLSAVDLDVGIIDYPRPKTGIPRRCALWPETVAALREALAKRPEPKKPEHAGLFFVTRCGDSWAKDTAENPVTNLMAKLLRKLRINGRKGIGFYTLRHTFRTVADEAKDQPAADYIMGHEVQHMSSVYRETISDARLRAVADHVRAWLFPAKQDRPQPKEAMTTAEVADGNESRQNAEE